MSDDNTGSMRLQKFLSRAGVASRRASEGLMAQGRVRVNGVRAVEPGTRVDPATDRVEVDGERVRMDAPRWILLNKPAGVLTTRKDPGGARTVHDLLPDDDDSLRYVGRLDRDTEGLLLFTNEGDVAHRLLHPSTGIPRRYRARVRGRPSRSTLKKLRSGILLEDGPARAEEARIVEVGPRHWPRAGSDHPVIELVLREGRKREVRRLFDAVDHPVERLVRIAFGPQRLVRVEPGAWRELDAEEVAALMKVGGR
ncbi:MAG: rRNA pseudouridine synthase [Gemmatimonadales bacterium]|nr:MAG: rRNA pseudouridine synthase [Gemmatimonadales bacterium]